MSATRASLKKGRKQAKEAARATKPAKGGRSGSRRKHGDQFEQIDGAESYYFKKA